MDNMETSTIAAISTGNCAAAIGVVRLSGPRAVEIVSRCLRRADLRPRVMHSRRLYDADGEILDDVLVCHFRAPHSFTGEDVVEIYAHGGAVNMARVLHAVCVAGARPAEPGEFSKRAFLHGKIDLARAEAIMDVIHAQNEVQCREAQRQLSGTVSESVSSLRSVLMSLLCAVEATIDFSTEEELAPMPVARLESDTAMAIDRIERMERAHERYRAGGLRTVIAGRPNAGKSSLFNLLVGHDRAIVTSVAGTTTDTIEASATIGGALFDLVDTAGLTETDRTVEAIGVARARDQVRAADLLLVVADGSRDDDGCLAEIRTILGDSLEEFVRDGRILLVRTKSDLPRSASDAALESFVREKHIPVYDVSVVTRSGMSALEDALVEIARAATARDPDVALITSERHIAHLRAAREALARSRAALTDGLPAECIAADIREAAQELALITGEFASEDVINEIFSHFCIGK